MVFEYKGMKISFCKEVYEPAEDSFLLLDVLEKEKWSGKEEVLEVGSGTGILSVFLAGKVKAVYALDINKQACACTKKNAWQNGSNIHVFCSDLFSAIGEKKFDAIIFNTPYLPEDETTEKFRDAAWSGGKSARAVIQPFLSDAIKHIPAGGKIFIVESSLSEYGKTLEFLEKSGFRANVVATKKAFFEYIVAIKAERQKFK